LFIAIVFPWAAISHLYQHRIPAVFNRVFCAVFRPNPTIRRFVKRKTTYLPHFWRDFAVSRGLFVFWGANVQDNA